MNVGGLSAFRRLSTIASGGQALQLYRAIWRASRGMPTIRRKKFVRDKLREEFEAARYETDPSKVAFALEYAALQLDTVRIQAASLSKLVCDPMYHNKREI